MYNFRQHVNLQIISKNSDTNTINWKEIEVARLERECEQLALELSETNCKRRKLESERIELKYKVKEMESKVIEKYSEVKEAESKLIREQDRIFTFLS